MEISSASVPPKKPRKLSVLKTSELGAVYSKLRNNFDSQPILQEEHILIDPVIGNAKNCSVEETALTLSQTSDLTSKGILITETPAPAIASALVSWDPEIEEIHEELHIDVAHEVEESNDLLTNKKVPTEMKPTISDSKAHSSRGRRASSTLPALDTKASPPTSSESTPSSLYQCSPYTPFAIDKTDLKSPRKGTLISDASNSTTRKPIPLSARNNAVSTVMAEKITEDSSHQKQSKATTTTVPQTPKLMESVFRGDSVTLPLRSPASISFKAETANINLHKRETNATENFSFAAAIGKFLSSENKTEIDTKTHFTPVLPSENQPLTPKDTKPKVSSSSTSGSSTTPSSSRITPKAGKGFIGQHIDLENYANSTMAPPPTTSPRPFQQPHPEKAVINRSKSTVTASVSISNATTSTWTSHKDPNPTSPTSLRPQPPPPRENNSSSTAILLPSSKPLNSSRRQSSLQVKTGPAVSSHDKHDDMENDVITVTDRVREQSPRNSFELGSLQQPNTQYQMTMRKIRRTSSTDSTSYSQLNPVIPVKPTRKSLTPMNEVWSSSDRKPGTFSRSKSLIHGSPAVIGASTKISVKGDGEGGGGGGGGTAGDSGGPSKLPFAQVSPFAKSVSFKDGEVTASSKAPGPFPGSTVTHAFTKKISFNGDKGGSEGTSATKGQLLSRPPTPLALSSRRQEKGDHDHAPPLTPLSKTSYGSNGFIPSQPNSPKHMSFGDAGIPGLSDMDSRMKSPTPSPRSRRSPKSIGHTGSVEDEDVSDTHGEDNGNTGKPRRGRRHKKDSSKRKGRGHSMMKFRSSFSSPTKRTLGERVANELDKQSFHAPDSNAMARFIRETSERLNRLMLSSTVESEVELSRNDKDIESMTTSSSASHSKRNSMDSSELTSASSSFVTRRGRHPRHNDGHDTDDTDFETHDIYRRESSDDDSDGENDSKEDDGEEGDERVAELVTVKSMQSSLKTPSMEAVVGSGTTAIVRVRRAESIHLEALAALITPNPSNPSSPRQKLDDLLGQISQSSTTSKNPNSPRRRLMEIYDSDHSDPSAATNITNAPHSVVVASTPPSLAAASSESHSRNEILTGCDKEASRIERTGDSDADTSISSAASHTSPMMNITPTQLFKNGSDDEDDELKRAMKYH